MPLQPLRANLRSLGNTRNICPQVCATTGYQHLLLVLTLPSCDFRQLYVELLVDTESATKATSERPRVSVSDNYCCSYDLARRMQPQLLEQHPLTVISLCNESPGTVLERVRTFLDANSTTVCQVVLPSIQRCDHIETDVVTDRLRLFLAVKHLVRERMASCLLTIQPTELSARMLRCVCGSAIAMLFFLHMRA